ncbi:hypothetical protein HK405_010130 [Cladochytrium tenue]|nr:hypothetical protein HK405_010130 [Cladochytrium tenue]
MDNAPTPTATPSPTPPAHRSQHYATGAKVVNVGAPGGNIDLVDGLAEQMGEEEEEEEEIADDDHDAPMQLLDTVQNQLDPGLPIAEDLARNSQTQRRSCEACRRRKIKCDGGQPSCGFCRRRNLSPCIYLATKLRVVAQIQAARQNAADDRRRRLRALAPAANSMPDQQSKLSWPNFTRAHAFGGRSDGIPTAVEKIVTKDVLAEVISSPQSLQAIDTMLLGLSMLPDDVPEDSVSLKRRPGAPSSEERVLVENFFNITVFTLAIVHKRTFLRNMREADPALRFVL